MKIRRDKKDALFSDLVRERANWTCEACGKQPERRMLHCAHIFGRRYRSTRWHPDNAIALCFSCHQHFTDNPTEFSGWVIERLGGTKGGGYAALRRLSVVVAKFSKHDLAQIEADLRAEVGLMANARKAGARGRIEFDAPRPVAQLEET